MTHRSRVIWLATLCGALCVACASRPPEAASPTSTSTFATIVSTVQTRPTVTVTLPPRPAVTTTTVQNAAPVGSGGNYTIKDGDVLSAISDRFGVSEQAILAANGLSDPNLLFAGRTIIIPGVDVNAQPAVTATTAAPAVTAAPSAAAAGGTYVIQDGDLLGALAIKFGVSEQAILAANGLSNPDLLYAGRTIIIPTDG